MANKVELTDEELDNVNGGIDFGMINGENVAKFAKAMFMGDVKTAQELILKFLSEGDNPTAVEKLIDKYANSKEGQTLLKNTLKSFM